MSGTQDHVEKQNVDKCDHAMLSLKQAMAWDEERFGLEYDLDIYMIVAVNDFNFGAMENKGLNIFNSKYVLARRHSHRYRFRRHPGSCRPRIFPQLDREPRNLSRLVQLSLKEASLSSETKNSART